MSLLDEAIRKDFKCSDIVDVRMMFQWVKTGKVTRLSFEKWLDHYAEEYYNERAYDAALTESERNYGHE